MRVTEPAVRACLLSLPHDRRREYALARAADIAASFHEHSVHECAELSALANGVDLVELHADVGAEYAVVGAGCSAAANFGGEGVHYRVARKCNVS